MSAAIGHNNPPDLIMTREEFRVQIVEKMTSSTDVLVGHTIEFLMDDDGVCNASIPEIMQGSKLKCRRAVMRSLARICERIGLVKAKVNGRRNQYFINQETTKPVRLKDTGIKDTSALKPPPLKDTGVSKPVRLKDTGSRTRDINKYNNYNNIYNNKHTNSEFSINSGAGVCVDQNLPEGFEPLGHGAIINCETIRHPNFSISIAAVKMQIDMTPGCQSEDVRQHCKSFALQWAAEIEGGKQPMTVLPANINRAIAGSIARKALMQDEASRRASRGKPSTIEAMQKIVGDYGK